MHRMPLVTPLVAGCLLVLGCGDNPAPVAPDTPIALQVIPQECTGITPPLTLEDLVRVDPDAPPLETLSTEFLAQAGVDQRFEIRFQGQHVTGTHTWFVRLRIRRETLQQDAVIQVVVDQASDGTELFSVQFEPPLTFNADEPAELEFHLATADERDLNGLASLRVFRQETPTPLEPNPLYECVPSLLDVVELTIEAELDSFTRYALAIGR